MDNYPDLSQPVAEENIYPDLSQAAEMPAQQEGFGGALMRAPFRVGSDVLGGAYNLARNAPAYLQAGKTEIPGLFKTAYQHPIHALAQAGAGLTELGHEALNLPRNTSNYLSSRLNLLPQGITEAIPYQKDISKDVNEVFGDPKYDGEKFLRGLVRNLPNIYGAKAIASTLNPMKFTSKNIAQGILDTESGLKQKYSSNYEDLFNKANKHGDVNVNPSKLMNDFDILARGTPEKYYRSLGNFMQDRTHQNAQSVVSDMGKLVRSLEKKTTLLSSEKDILNSAINIKNNIQENMFRNKYGDLNNSLADKYAALQEGYRKEVVPYTTNKNIQAFKRQDITEKEFIESLKKGPFAAKRGEHHPELNRNEALKKAIVGLGVAGGLFAGGKTGYQYLTGKSD